MRSKLKLCQILIYASPLLAVTLGMLGLIIAQRDMLLSGAEFFWGNPRYFLFKPNGFHPNYIAVIPSYCWTIARLISGVLIGVGFGITIGVFADINDKVRKWYYTFLIILAPISPSLWTRILCSIFGVGFWICVAVIAIGTSVLVAIGTILTLRKMPAQYSMIADVHRIRGVARLVFVVLPFLIPSIHMFIRVCLLVAWGAIFYVESFGIQDGAGRILVEVYQTNNIGAVCVICASLVILATIIDLAVAKICHSISTVPKFLH